LFAINSAALSGTPDMLLTALLELQPLRMAALLNISVLITFFSFIIGFCMLSKMLFDIARFAGKNAR
jgi:hypothetical protein